MSALSKFALIGAVMTAVSGAALAMSDTEYDARVAAVNHKYRSTYEAAVRESRDIATGSKPCFLEGTFDTDWEPIEVGFDIPEVTMKHREFGFHTLKSKLTSKVIVTTKTPVIRWKIHRIGFVRIRIPELAMKLRQIRIPVPTFWWDRTTFVLKVPEFSSRRVEWTFPLPEIAPCENEKRRAEALSSKVEKIASAQKHELNAITWEHLITKSRELEAQRQATMIEFDRGLSSLDRAIEQIRRTGANPASAIVNVDGQQFTLIGGRAALIRRKQAALQALDDIRNRIVDALTDLN